MQGVDGPQEFKKPEKEPEYGENRYIFYVHFLYGRERNSDTRI